MIDKREVICCCCGESYTPKSNEKKTIYYCPECLEKIKGDGNNAKNYN